MVEVNFDGIPGPFHNYGGLSFGNVASIKHGSLTSNPKAAALQGLEKMKFLFDLGLSQAVLPPQERPAVGILRSLGFVGTDAEVIQKAAKRAPQVFLNCCSSSSMWSANAATVSPSPDLKAGKVHFTIANLVSKFHRSIELETTTRVFRKIFSNPNHFVVHDGLPGTTDFGDEGAANHTRFCKSHGEPGIEFFTYGRSQADPKTQMTRFPARQTREASEAIARLHQLNPKYVVFARQNAEAIDAGVFHNDVISVGNENVFLFHQKAFENQNEVLEKLSRAYQDLTGEELCKVEVSEAEVSLPEVVESYLFNSQLLTLPKDKGPKEMLILAPEEAQKMDRVRDRLEQMVDDSHNPIKKVMYRDLRQSMQNGGGPACLRLRVVLSPDELKAAHTEVFFTANLYSSLKGWIEKHYRDHLTPQDLADPKLLLETREALDELCQILKLGGDLYYFQR